MLNGPPKTVDCRLCGKTVSLKEVETALHLGGRTSYFCKGCLPRLTVDQVVQILNAIRELPDSEEAEPEPAGG